MKKLEYQSLLKKNENTLFQIKECGNHIEVTYIENQNNKQNIQKLSDKEYINLITGELKKFEKKSKREDNLNYVKQSIKNLRDIINTNTMFPDRVLFVTLTYKENMQDRKKLMRDYEIFYKRFKRYCLKKYNEFPRYICVPEPQERGAWHCHILFIFNQKSPYISNNEIANMWGNGFVNIKKCDNCDNIGAYLSAYLTNTKEKKGARLHYYPVGMHLYRTSKDINRPIIHYENKKFITEILQKDYELTYWASYTSNYEDNYGNRIEKRYYKIKKPK